MQRQGHPLRPMPVQGTGELQQILELARSGALQPQRSAFSTVTGGQALLPEFSLYNAAQLSGLLNNTSGISIEQLAQLQQLQSLQRQTGAAALLGAQQTLPESSSSKISMTRGSSRGDKNSSAYASRHQAAEQRRRTRINDRLDRLRQIVPHSERANTATFLEEVIHYIEALQARLTEVETAHGLPLSCPSNRKQHIIPQQLSQQPPLAAQLTCSPGSATASFLPNVIAFRPQPVQQLSSSIGQQSVGTSAANGPAAISQGQGQKERPETPPQATVVGASGDADQGTVVEAIARAAGEETAETYSDESAPKREKADESVALA